MGITRIQATISALYRWIQEGENHYSTNLEAEFPI